MTAEWLTDLLGIELATEVEDEIIQRASTFHPRGKVSVPVFDEFDQPWAEGCLTCNSQSCRLVRDLTTLLRMH